ncbi:uncharacterized protein [Cherax quadricarinatus]
MKWHTLAALLLLVMLEGVVEGVVEGVGEGRSGYDRRMTKEEREEVFQRMRRTIVNDDLICLPPDDPPANTDPLPTIPRSFTTKVEIALQMTDQLFLAYGTESFDGVFNRGVLAYELGEGLVNDRPHMQEEIVHYDMTKNESLIIITDTSCEDTGEENCDPKKTCHAKTTKELVNEMSSVFGFGSAIGANGIFGTMGVLEWGPQNNYVYMGKENCRGMQCDRYQACITDKEGVPVVKLVYFWSASSWHVASNGPSVPVAVEIQSTGKYGTLVTREVMQRFDFYEVLRDFRPSLEELMPPGDVYCKSRKSQYDPPVVPYYFSYDSEAVAGFDVTIAIGDNETEKIEFTVAFSQSEFYDWNAKIVMTEYVPWYIFGEVYRYEFETQRIQDFNQGLEYYLQKHQDKKCRYGIIQNSSSGGDVVVNDDGSVSLQPPWIFENLDEPMQYNGIHSARDMEADVWIGLKNHLLSLISENFVWFYASPLVVDEIVNKEVYGREEKNGKLKIKKTKPYLPKASLVSMDKVPLKLEKYTNILANYPHLIYNIFNYETDPPQTHMFDISPCYNDSQSRDFILDLPSDTLEMVQYRTDTLLYSAQEALAEVGVISPLRINRIVLEERDDVLRLLFTILDKAEVEGDAPGILKESNLNTAVSLINSAVSSSKLVIVVRLNSLMNEYSKVKDSDIVAVVPVAGSMVQVQRGKNNDYSYTTSKGYQSGDMAGLAIGMLIVGTLVGVAVTMVVKHGTASPSGLPRVSMAHKSAPNSSNTINVTADLTASDI